MQNEENKNSIVHIAVLAGLWFINILIVIFSSPFLIYKKLMEIFFKKAKNSQPQIEAEKTAAQYFPCRSDS